MSRTVVKSQSRGLDPDQIQSQRMPLCRCMIKSVCASSLWWTRSLRFSRSSAVSNMHQEGCPMQHMSRKKTVIEIKYPLRNLWVSRLISFSLALTTGAGKSTIAPNLTFRATVSDDSPAFRLLRYGAVAHWRKSHADSYYPWVKNEFLTLFQERKASPSDVTLRGETLLHVSELMIVIDKTESKFSGLATRSGTQAVFLDMRWKTITT